MKIKALTLKINLLSGGGSNHDLHLKLKYLKSRGHNTSLITLFSNDNNIPEKIPYPIIEKRFSGGFIDMQNFIYKILMEYERDTDVFYLHGHAFLWAAGKYRKNGGTAPVIVFVNNYTPGMGLANNEIETKNIIGSVKFFINNLIHRNKKLLWEKIFGLASAKYIDKIIADSPVVKNIYAAFGFNEEKIIVIPDFLDLKKLNKKGVRTTGPSFEKREGFLNILYVGRLIADKGVDLVIRAIKLIDKELQRESKIHLHIVGAGPQLKKILNLVRHYALQGRVTIYGWRSKNELASFYKHADIFIHPSRWPEPLGHTIIEAMFFKKPIITSVNSGSAWAMNGNGLLFRNNNINDLKERILEFYNNRSLLYFYGRNARKRAEEFDYRKLAGEFEKALKDA